MNRNLCSVEKEITGAGKVQSSARGFTLIAIVVVAYLCFPPNSHAQDESRQLSVTVIAVTHFDDGRLVNDALIRGVNDATQQLYTFFTTRYGVTPRVFNTKAETTAQAVREWLFHDLSQDTQQGIKLVFILTHGTGYLYPASTQFKNELFLATSDTSADDYFGTAIRGSELVDAFQRLRKGSSVFLFIDTCGSGSIDNAGILQMLQANQATATRMMILTASMADESAFRARLTKALLKIWQLPRQPAPNDCHYGENDIPEYVDAVMNSTDPMPTNLTQNTKLAFPYSKDFCIESFDSEVALALLANPTDEELKATLQLVKDPRDSIPRRVPAHSVRPIVLRRDAYTIDAEPAFASSTRRPVSLTLDFSADFVQYAQLNSADPLDAALTKHEAAIFADDWGAPPAIIAQLTSSAESDLHQASVSASADSKQLEQTIAMGQTRIVNLMNSSAENAIKISAINEQVSKLGDALKKKDEAMRKNTTAPNPFDKAVASGVRSELDFETLEFLKARDLEHELEATAGKVAEDLNAEKKKLSDAENEKRKVDLQLTSVGNISRDISESLAHVKAQQTIRADLSRALNGVYPTSDAARGLVVSIPAGEISKTKLSDLGKLLASNGSQLLVEIESFFSGNDSGKSQQEATRSALAIQNALSSGTGLRREWTVVRGLPGLPKGAATDAKSLNRVIISGDTLGEHPANMQF
jgi:hypothetical protein